MLDYQWYQRLHRQLWFALLSWISPIADRIEISARFRYLGGRPYTEPTYISENRIWAVPSVAPLNAARYEPYHSLDLRFERRFGFGFLTMIYYFDFKNLYGHRNVWQYLYVDGKDTRSTIYQLPFFPAGGLIIGF